MGQFAGPTDPAADARWPEHQSRKGFFTDTSICIGCKACEVACKEWNRNPLDGDLQLLESSYDNTGALGASTWRHVAFIEQGKSRIEEARASGRALVDLGMPGMRAPDTGTPGMGAPGVGAPGVGAAVLAPAPPDGAASTGDPGVDTTPPDTPEFRWLMSSDVCKHCTHAGCLDVCPTGALFRTEFGTVVVQADVCNGCGTCVAGCPFGVVERRRDGTAAPNTERNGHDARGSGNGQRPEVPNVGVAQKCTLCYDRMIDGQTPACAKTCPTTSIKFGDHDEMVSLARERVAELHAQGRTEARLYGANDLDGVGGTGSVFLLLDEPEVYGLPPDPRVPTADLPRMFNMAGLAAGGMIAAVVVSFMKGRS
jgi:formate dehydrogenase iron-sulfur subunit